MTAIASSKFGYAGSDYPYVVLIGQCGTGKSTIVEKLTNEKDRSGDGHESTTKSAEPFWTFDGSMVICDTPGTNPMAGQFMHNVHVAAALNFKPVARILIVVKAETRMASPLGHIREFTTSLLQLPDTIIGALVTHMDTVSWTEGQFKSCSKDQLGIDCVLFSKKNTRQKRLFDDIMAACTQTMNLKIDHENFLKLFKIGKEERKIMLEIADEVQCFKDIKEQFDEVRKSYKGKDEIDLIFEFQTWMEDQVVRAQQKLAKSNNFEFYGVRAEAEAGYSANMTNQMRLVLFDLRVEAAGYHNEHGAGDARRCPYCNEVWIKVEACDGVTTCGNRPVEKKIDVRDPSYAVLGTYKFSWLKDKFIKLTISKHTDRKVEHTDRKVEQKLTSDPGSKWGPIGCGKSITWKTLAKVDIPQDLASVIKPFRMDEVPILSTTVPGASKWHATVDNALGSTLEQIKLDENPNPNGAKSK